MLNRSWQEILILLPCLLVALTVHELCHGYVAYRLGDDTAKNDGRLSLNPLKHIDIMGFLCLLVAGFGWAKPVMVNTYNLRNPKKGMAIIAAAGPLSNLTLALISLALILPLVALADAPAIVFIFIRNFAWLNIILFTFNLIPVPPLDGSKIIAGFLSDHIHRKFLAYERYGAIILIVLIVTGLTGRIIFPIADWTYDTLARIGFHIYTLIAL